MKITHDYAARIDYDLWMDCLKVKELDGGTTSINALVNEGHNFQVCCLKWCTLRRKCPG